MTLERVLIYALIEFEVFATIWLVSATISLYCMALAIVRDRTRWRTQDTAHFLFEVLPWGPAATYFYVRDVAK